MAFRVAACSDPDHERLRGLASHYVTNKHVTKCKLWALNGCTDHGLEIAK